MFYFFALPAIVLAAGRLLKRPGRLQSAARAAETATVIRAAR